MTLTSRTLAVSCMSSLLAGCLAPQVLGDPQESDGGETSGGSGTSDSSGDPTTTGPEDTDIGMASGSDSTGTKPDECLPQGSVCPGPTGFSECCGTSICSADTGICEAQDKKGGEFCSDFAPPPFDCPSQGDAQVSLDPSESFSYPQSQPCEVIELVSDDADRWTVGLECDDEFPEFTYLSAAPHIGPPLDVGSQVLYTAVDFEEGPGFDASVALHAPDGRLLLAYVDHFDLAQPLPVDITPLELSFAGTGCFGFDAGAVTCDNDAESIVAARVSVEVGPGALASIADGNAEVFVLGDRQYQVSVGEASRIVCWDDGCAGDEGGPYDRLRMLIVAEPLLPPR